LDVHRVSEAWQKDGGKFIPNPGSWLKKRRWTDDLAAYRPAHDSATMYDEPGSDPVFELETAPDGRRIAVKARKD
jgi:hypothetical protein